MKLPKRYDPKTKKSGGGMSHVVLCNDTQLDRHVIVKYLDDVTDRTRLLDEIHALQTIRSGYVVQIFDVIANESGDIGAIVEEYCEGQDLSDWISEVDSEDFVKFGYQLATGLAEIHECGVVHRDIKPNNVRVNDINHLTIIDFGLARISSVDDRTISEIGTTGFMAPELFNYSSGGHIHFTPAIDIFALASTLYLLAEGELPKCILRRPPKILSSDLDFSLIDIDIDQNLSELLSKCFSVDPTLRPTARQVSNEFRRVILHDKHRALVNIRGSANYLDKSNRSVVVSVKNLGSVTIEYNGDLFKVTSVSGEVYINNIQVSIDFIIPGCCVIALGGPERQWDRAYVTFDISHPGVEI